VPSEHAAQAVGFRDTPGRIDTAALKRGAPIDDVVARYGIELRRCGRALVGWCPFHDDQGRPNLWVYPGSDSFYCYRCNVGGDTIDFVERIERVDFRAAVERLASRTYGAAPATVPPARRSVGARRERLWRTGARAGPGAAEHSRAFRDPAEQACLAAAVELYHNRLRSDSRARAYVEGRGLTWPTVEECCLGYADGDELGDFLRWRRRPLGAARRTGLLTGEGRDFMAGRVVVPEIRGGEVVWLVGRAISPNAEPRYLGLPGRKPLLGWEAAHDARTVVLVEGVFDVLVLQQWGIPALALVGTHARPDALAALGRFERVYLALDRDEAGQSATTALARALGERAVPVTLPALPGVKDVADLVLRAEGRHLFARALLDAAQPAASARPASRPGVDEDPEAAAAAA
jgi:DNA primase